MNPTIDILRGELERLFTLEEMTSMSERLLGLAPADVGGASAKGSFARALSQRCLEGDRLDALVDVIVHSRKEVDPRVRDVAHLRSQRADDEGLAVGRLLGDFRLDAKIGENDRGVVFRAVRTDGAAKATVALKVLRRESSRDRRAVHRFLTATRLVGSVDHPGLPRHVEASEVESGSFYVAYEFFPAQPLSASMTDAGPRTFDELRPLLNAILAPLAALHDAHLAHGNLKAENILVATDVDGTEATTEASAAKEPRVVLVDFGTDRLCVGGRPADVKTDVYAFGKVLFELLTGASPFPQGSARDAFASGPPRCLDAPSLRAPGAAISGDLDALVLSLLDNDPGRRPKDASAVRSALDALVQVGLASGESPRAVTALSPESVQEKIDALLNTPGDVEAAIELERAAWDGAHAARVADAFRAAAERVVGETAGDRETKKALLYRAARTFDGAANDKVGAELTYAALLLQDPTDDVARMALESTRKALGKYDELVEMLLDKSQTAQPGQPRGRALAEIGRLYANELEDSDQALIAFTQALCEVPSSEEHATDVARLCGMKPARWAETLATLTETIKSDSLSPLDLTALLVRTAGWYDIHLGRADMALAAYEQVLSRDPASEVAASGLTAIYRRAEQWPELVALLLARAECAPSAPKARDLRTDAAEWFDLRLNDAPRARALLSAVLADDPDHLRASSLMADIAERAGDFRALADLLARRAEGRRGNEKVEALVNVAEVYERHLDDLSEATRGFEAALALAPTNLRALKGLDRIFSRSGQYRELLAILDRESLVAATPRQKIGLFERVARLRDEEFLDHAGAAEALEAILAIDPAHDFALTALARHYRSLAKWEPLVALYETHAGSTGDDSRKVELLVAKARTLAEHVGSPERAMQAYEQILASQPSHAGALEALARLREMSGDANAAVEVIETLAAKAATPEAKAEQWMRAGRLLDARGNKDGAIDRYKRALDAHPNDVAASSALRSAHTLRHDWLSVVGLLERDLAHAASDLAKARLYAELAKVYHAHLVDGRKAEAAALKALALDSSNAESLLVLGDLAFEEGRLVEAATYYESLVGRAGVLPKEEAVRVLVRFIEAFGKTHSPAPQAPRSGRDVSHASSHGLSASPASSLAFAAIAPSPASQSRLALESQASGSVPPAPLTNPRMLSAVEALQSLAVQDVDALARAANALFEFGDPQSAYRMHKDLFETFDADLVGSDRAEALYHLGESARRSGDLEKARKPLQEAAELDPSNPRPFRALAKLHDAKGEVDAALAVRRKRLPLAMGQERFDLLLEIGDAMFVHQGDRTGASKAFALALEERPDDRRLLTKLMQLYSEEKDWAKVVEVVLRLADFVDDPRQRAKYMHTAATIASSHLGNVDQAIRFYAKVLELAPDNAKALDEVLELYRGKESYADVERILKLQLEQAKATANRDKLICVLDQLGELYEKHLGERELAIDAFEAALAFDPEDRARAAKLGGLYALDPLQYFDKAVHAETQALRRNPYRVESYKALRALFAVAQKRDAEWCLCQALSVLRLAEPDEEVTYKKHRAETAAPAQSALDADGFGRLMHADLDPLLTQVFALIEPSILRARTQPLEAMGYDPRTALDCAMHPYAVSQTLLYAAGVLGMPAPIVFQDGDEPGSLGMVHALTPAIVLGRAAFEGQPSTQALAFAAGRHLAYFRPGFYVRHLVPTGTGLKAWLFAAIKVCVPQFPIASDNQGQVNDAMAELIPDFFGAQKERLASAVSKVLQAGGALDLKKWVASIDLTTDRVGFLLAHDLQTSTEVVRATADSSSVSVKERMKELVLFSVSEEYFALRERLRIAVDV